MSVLSYHLSRSIKWGSLKSIYESTSLSKRSYSYLTVRKELAIRRSAGVNCHPVFTVSKRNLRKHLAALGGFGTSHLKPQHAKDDISAAFQFVYGSSNTRLFIYWTPAIFIAITVILIICGKTIYDGHMLEKEISDYELTRFQAIVDKLNPMEVAYFLTPVTLLLLFTVCRYVGTVLLRMYFNSSTNEFVAVILRYGLVKKKVHFRHDDVIFLKKFGLKGNVIIKGNHVNVAESNFVNTSVYNIFMGYKIDKPSEYKAQMEKEDIVKVLEEMAKRKEKQDLKDFAKKYEEKRKRRALKKINEN